MISKNITKWILRTNFVLIVSFIITIIIIIFVPVKFRIQAQGILDPEDAVLIKSKIDGIVEKIYIEEGQRIQEGEKLIKLNSPEIEIDRERILAEYKNSYFLYQNGQKLYKKGYISQKEFVERETDYQIKKVLKKKLDSYEIISPISGYILSQKELRLKRGDFIKKGTLLAKVSNLERFVVRTFVSEDKISRVKEGQKATVELRGMPNYQGHFKAEVIKIVPEGRDEDGIRFFEVILSLNESVVPQKYIQYHKLYSMMSGKVNIIYSDTTILRHFVSEKMGL